MAEASRPFLAERGGGSARNRRIVTNQGLTLFPSGSYMRRLKTLLARISCVLLVSICCYQSFIAPVDRPTRIASLIVALLFTTYFVIDLFSARIMALRYFASMDEQTLVRRDRILYLSIMTGGGFLLLFATYQVDLQFWFLKVFFYGLAGGGIFLCLCFIWEALRKG